MRRTSHDHSDSRASRNRKEPEGQVSVSEGRTSRWDSHHSCNLDRDMDPLRQKLEIQVQPIQTQPVQLWASHRSQENPQHLKVQSREVQKWEIRQHLEYQTWERDSGIRGCQLFGTRRGLDIQDSCMLAVVNHLFLEMVQRHLGSL